ncbi:putative disease resistance protein At3g14460 [Brachypodium distachyon]|uniref:BED-type domain-containing protein n=1 Tax=Brachypodium distachyon TaxID=15368 RepID=I1J1Z0_BRADI|nr:putative disease resistance protein At3g14460 [Brachypodium distachyon]KQJ84678.1 hypothetical protein BRADI_5g22187v3 [Brachypodium distachyon]|eukprot:XP_003579311.1 putative disease resistance protein At3g14460 [Brachypodium distachyon]
MEAAIAWLAGTILATLLIDKLVEWIRQVGLADDVEKLKFEIQRVNRVVSAVNGRAARNQPLADSLARLEELLYDADDLVDELHYYTLQQQVEGVTADDPEVVLVPAAEEVDDTSRGNADMPSNRSGKKLRSESWNEFDVTEKENEKPVKARCKHCLVEVKCGTKNGTSGMRNHLNVCKKHQSQNLSSTGDATTAHVAPIVIGDSSSRKRKRTDEVSVQITAPNTHRPSDKAELSSRIQKITSQLQDIRGAVSEVLNLLHGSDFASSSNHPADDHLGTSSLVSMIVYGRVSEKNSIMKLMMAGDRSDSVTVLPIVGIAGVGKTTLAQLVYNDPKVEDHFDLRIWVWVSRNFDKVGLTRKMLDSVQSERILDSVPQERHEGLNCFAKLQEILKSHVTSKRVLLILDDVWDDMNIGRWNQLLAPFKSNGSKGNMILVTTRKPSVAKVIGTAEPIKLGALENDDFCLLFKSCAFGDADYKAPGNLSTIGRQIAEKLKGNPLGAVTAGKLLRDSLTVDHWSKILKNENWKSLGLSEGIMPALKLSYDELPYHLQRCLSYCSIFPNKFQFLGKELVYIWISQGFVNCTGSSKRLEEQGWEYLIDLTNMGFFQQVGREESFSFDQSNCETCYVICGLMYDFVRAISKTECATIDGLPCNEMLSTVRHLSIVTDSAYIKDQHGKIHRNEKFEENLKNKVTSVSNLRTLVLLGHYDSSFFQVFQDIFQKGQNLRLLQISATDADFNSFQRGLVTPMHLRYLKRVSDGFDGALPQVLIKCLHLQVLYISSDTICTVPSGMHNLPSLRHLVAEKGVDFSPVCIASMTSLQELHEFKVQFCSSGPEIAQLQSMNKLVQLGLSGLNYVKSREEAYSAGLRNKQHLEKLHLSWEFFGMDDGGPSSEPSMDTAREVLEGFEPHMDLKHLQISGYGSTMSPTWLACSISLTSLQTLHLDSCGQWQILPSMEWFPLLTKLNLSNLPKVIEVSVPSLEELVLVKMPNLARCSCTSVGGLSSSLKALQIEHCQALKAFDLFQNNDKFEIKQWSWLPAVRKLILRGCPQLEVLNPLPPSTTFSELLISGVSTLPSMEGSYEKLHIGPPDFNPSSESIKAAEVLAFHNLTSLKFLSIGDKENQMSILFKDLRHLVSLKSLRIQECDIVFSSCVMPEHTREDVPAANCNVFPSLQSLTVESCGITGKVLSLMLQHSPDLKKLDLSDCSAITLLSIEEEGNSLSNLTSYREPQDELFLHIPSNLTFTLKEITIAGCPCLRLNGSNKGFSGFTSLEKLDIWGCPELLSSLVRRDGIDDQANGRWLLPESLGELYIGDYPEKTLQPCFPSNLTSLKKLVLWNADLKSLQLHSCTAMEELEIENCESLSEVEGLQSLSSLRDLTVLNCPCLRESLGELDIGDYPEKTLQPCFPGSLTSLKKLVLSRADLRCLQLHSCTALEELEINYCDSLSEVEGLQSLGSLKKLVLSRADLRCLQLHSCTALEELKIEYCNSLSIVEGMQSLGCLKKLVLSRADLQSIQLHSCTALEELKIEYCNSLSIVEGMQSLGCLKKLVLSRADLQSIQLHSCTALEELEIRYCNSLSIVEGLQSLGSLRDLTVRNCPCLPSYLESFSRQCNELLPRLGTLVIGDPAVLTTSFCKRLTSLHSLQLRLWRTGVTRLTEEQERALVLLKSLQELTFYGCYRLMHLPAGLHTLPSLKRLKIEYCSRILRLPETGLPDSLEELEIISCSDELDEECMLLATPMSKLKVKIIPRC